MFSPGARESKRKKLELREVFNADEDDNATLPQKKRKLVPLGEYGTYIRNFTGILLFISKTFIFLILL